jgi:uncharacterized protein YcnI
MNTKPFLSLSVLATTAVSLFALFAGATLASAHVIVTPNTAGVASFQNFTVSVPTERDVPTVGLKLLLPPGLQEVSPDVKAGWKIMVKTGSSATALTGDDDSAPVTEIDWTGGEIPVGERDQFIFTAQVPAEPATLVWKAYQTYKDGVVISWDQTPTGGDDETATTGPYSQTQIINDLGPGTGGVSSTTPSPSSASTSKTLAGWALAISIVALFISILSANRRRGS